MSQQNQNVKLNLFKPAQNTMAYLKMGIFGDTGSGKTWTAHLVAKGLHKFIKDNRPVAFFDTETGSSFVKPSFDNANIPLVTFQGHALADLTTAIKEAEQHCSLLIIDSISHVWDEYTDSYLKKSKRGYIELWDWKPIKSKWREMFVNPFVNSNLHIILCGRQSGIYEEREENRGGKKVSKSVRVGDKMKAESEVGYEPSILCQMEKVFLEDGGKYARKCNIIKERFNIIDSKEFINPTFKDFLPHIKLLNIGGDHLGIDTSRDSTGLFDEPNNSWDERKRKIQITLDKIKDHFLMNDLTGSKVDVKKCLVALLEEVFGTSSWTEIEAMKLEKLESCYSKLLDMDLISYRENFEKSNLKLAS